VPLPAGVTVAAEGEPSPGAWRLVALRAPRRGMARRIFRHTTHWRALYPRR
jgi:hypothetical protein